MQVNEWTSQTFHLDCHRLRRTFHQASSPEALFERIVNLEAESWYLVDREFFILRKVIIDSFCSMQFCMYYRRKERDCVYVRGVFPRRGESTSARSFSPAEFRGTRLPFPSC
jgi:hypothetical protein